MTRAPKTISSTGDLVSTSWRIDKRLNAAQLIAAGVQIIILAVFLANLDFRVSALERSNTNYSTYDGRLILLEERTKGNTDTLQRIDQRLERIDDRLQRSGR